MPFAILEVLPSAPHSEGTAIRGDQRALKPRTSWRGVSSFTEGAAEEGRGSGIGSLPGLAPRASPPASPLPPWPSQAPHPSHVSLSRSVRSPGLTRCQSFTAHET